MDTDTLLALLSSLLHEPLPSTSTLLDALVSCDGNVEAAAKHLSQTNISSKPVSQKRKRLDDWVTVPASNRVNKPSSSKCTAKERSVSPSPARKLPRIAPLTLSNPSMVAEHIPCTLHYSILPPELACELFYTMLDASKAWSRNKWWLFDRLVESPHRTSFFARLNDSDGFDENDKEEAARFWYNGRKTDPPEPFPRAMEAACVYIEKKVNEELQKRKRFPLEWGGEFSEKKTWRANVAASNCYAGGKEMVGFHSDQLTYLGPYPTIASLSLGTTRMFRLREVVPTAEANSRQARTYNIPLPHNSLTIMHASCQERFKHSVPPQQAIDMFRPPYPRSGSSGEIEPSNCRINITFRFYRPDFLPKKTPLCDCGVPTILRPDMKHVDDSGAPRKYWWACYAGAQNEGKGCKKWKVMDVTAEGRGPFLGDKSHEDENKNSGSKA